MGKKLFIFGLAFVFAIAIASAYHYDPYITSTSYKKSTPYSTISEKQTTTSNLISYSYKSSYNYNNPLYNYFSYGLDPHYFNEEYKYFKFNPKTYAKTYAYDPQFSKSFNPVPPYYYGPKGSLLKPEYYPQPYEKRVLSQRYIPYKWHLEGY